MGADWGVYFRSLDWGHVAYQELVIFALQTRKSFVGIIRGGRLGGCCRLNEATRYKFRPLRTSAGYLYLPCRTYNVHISRGISPL
jgi:hypothetical protein